MISDIKMWKIESGDEKGWHREKESQGSHCSSLPLLNISGNYLFENQKTKVEQF